MSRFYPTYKDGEGFPGHTCISINEEVVHGIPGPRRLRDGDVVTLDLALMVGGFCCDTAITVADRHRQPAGAEAARRHPRDARPGRAST